MTRIDSVFIRSHFQADYIEDVLDQWEGVRKAVLNARRILSNPEHFPNANYDYLEKLDIEGTIFLLQAPVQYIV